LEERVPVDVAQQVVQVVVGEDLGAQERRLLGRGRRREVDLEPFAAGLFERLVLAVLELWMRVFKIEYLL